MFTALIATQIRDWFGPIAYMIFAFSLMTVAPFVMVGLFASALVRKAISPGIGAWAGLGLGAWASICWLTVPYCGGYPNIPGALIGAFIFSAGSVGQEICIHATNLLLWPFVGGLFSRLLSCSSTSNSPISPNAPVDASSPDDTPR